ncbi:MAG TPA: hypothetical protein VNG29_04400 [Candidatus Paceibacterota bacterium]|nr:hypothetical protein [Candidatus Paceibacterota bacterium]
MISRDDIQQIIETGVQAPSGDNSQPWRFEAEGDSIRVFNLPEKDNPVLNYEQRGSYIAHGGVVENMVIAAAESGYAANVLPFPNPSDATLTATIEFAPERNAKKDPLFPAIRARHTNRRPYEQAPLTSRERMALNAAVTHFGAEKNLSFVLVSDPRKQSELAAAGACIETVILEDRALHRLLFKDVIWSEAEERRVHGGLFIDTMEFMLPQRAVFWLASHWPAIRLLNGLGLSRFIAREDAKLYATGAGFGALLLNRAEPADVLLAGRAMQRLWLTAASLGISLQPVTGLIFAAMRLGGKNQKVFSEKHAAMIGSNYGKMLEALDARDRAPIMAFRLGHAPAPSAICTRKSPNITFK